MVRPEIKMRQTAQISLGAVLSIAAAVGSIVCSVYGRWAWGLGVGAAAVFFGLVGFVQAAAPRIRGALFSFLGIVLGLVALIVAIGVLMARLLHRGS